jgi:hypothetical protein
MLYTVEAVIEAGHLAHELSQMRTWLDHMKFEAVGFRQIAGADLCRVDFDNKQQATKFAQAFSGRLLNRALASEPESSAGSPRPEPARPWSPKVVVAVMPRPSPSSG